MKIAIVGATGLVGRNIIQLCEKNFNSDVEYSLFASKSSEGREIKINDKGFVVKELKMSPNPTPVRASKSIRIGKRIISG